MRSALSIVAIGLGVVGVLACPVAIALGWWGMARTVNCATVVAARLDDGLAEADARLARIEPRLALVRAEFNETRGEAESLAEKNPDLPEVRAAIDKLVARLLPTVERTAELADSLRAVAAGLRAAVDIAVELGADINEPSRARAAADAIDRAAEMLDIPQERITAVRSAAALRLKRELVELTLTAVAGSERLAEGITDARQELTAARERIDVARAQVIVWVRGAAVVHTLVWIWIGLGQLALIAWGRRRLAR
jgi:chromosome segregation ATPase